MFLRITLIALTILGIGMADTLTLRNGQVVRGEYLGGDARHVKMAVGDRVETYLVDDVAELQFGGGGRQLSDYPPPRSERPTSDAGGQIPSGTQVTIRMIDSVDSDQARLGQTFRASVDDPVLVNGQTVIPRGADAIVKLVEDRQSGKIEGRTVLTLTLTDVIVNGRNIDFTTGDVSQSSSSRGARSGKVIGGTAALGAIIGAIAGGGKGAAIGAGAGAATGTGIQMATHGQRVRVPSETRLTFTLQQPANL